MIAAARTRVFTCVGYLAGLAFALHHLLGG